MRKLKLYHPLHSIMGLALTYAGIILLVNHHYFFWPPFLVSFLNDDAISVLAILAGVTMIWWSFKDKDLDRVNLSLLLFSCFFWMFQATAETVHSTVIHRPHMLMLAGIEVVMFLFAFYLIKNKKQR